MFEDEEGAKTPVETLDFLVGEGGASLEGTAADEEPLENLDFLTIVVLENAVAPAILDATARFSSVTAAAGLSLRRERVDCTFFLDDGGVEPAAKTGEGILDMVAMWTRERR